MNIVAIEVYRYSLESLTPLNSQSFAVAHAGALLRVTHDDGAIGHADCHPWPELGDPALDEQLALLARRNFTAITARSCALAALDAKFRRRGQNCLAGLNIPPSHRLVLNLAQLDAASLRGIAAQGFTLIKAKAGRNIASDAAAVVRLAPQLQRLHLKLRLDFNAALQRSQFERFLRAIAPVLQAIDLIEDPCAFDARAWSEIRSRHGVRLAADRNSDTCEISSQAADVLILKPAGQDPAKLLQRARDRGLKLCVTSAMDHPIGQLGAAFCAAEIFRDCPELLEPCGLLSHTAYRSNAFIDRLQLAGPSLLGADGAGMGFDALLDELDWKPLA